MKKQDILDEIARRTGDEDGAFKANQLSKIFDFVLFELSQEDCLSLLRKATSFVFTNAACVASGGIMNINTQTLLGLPVGSLPERISEDLFVAGWGVQSRIQRVSDRDFLNSWQTADPTLTSRPRIWRVYPTLAQLQLWPTPGATDIGSSCILEWQASPTTLADNADITEILPSDLPTLLAGCYRYGILFQDPTLSDKNEAEGRWQAGLMRMRERIKKSLFYGRKTQIRYVDY